MQHTDAIPIPATSLKIPNPQGIQDTQDGQVTAEPAGDDLEQPLNAQFTMLYDRYSPMLFRYALRRLGASLAQDAVADTFLAVYTSWQSYDPGRGEVRPWLFGILTRKIAQHHRAETAHYRLLATMPVSAPVDDVAERISETVTADMARPALVSALAVLHNRDRDVLLLIAWAGLSYPEVADVLGIPVGTVRSRLNRARRILREHLRYDGPVG